MQYKSLKQEEFFNNHNKLFRKFLPQTPDSDLISKYRNKYILIDGDKGAGKTSLKTALLCIFYQLNHFREQQFIKFKLFDLIKRGFFRKKEYQNVDILKLNQELYAKGLNILTPEDYCDLDIDIDNPPHAIYDTEFSALTLDKDDNPLELSHDIDFEEIRMPNAKRKFKTLLPYSVVASSEDIDLANNSKADTLDVSKYEFNKKQRHNGITQLAETQYGETVAKWQRRSVDVLIYIQRRYDKFKFCWNNKNPTTWGETKHKRKIRSTWYCWIYEGQRVVQRCGYSHLAPLSTLENSLLQRNPTEELILRSQIKTCKITFKGNINKHYDSEACQGEFYANFNGFNINEQKSLRPDYTAKDVNDRYDLRNAASQKDSQNTSKNA